MQVYQMILKYQAIKEKLENKRMSSTVDVNDVLKDLDNLDPFESYIPEVPECVKDWYYEVQSDFYNSLDNLIRFCYMNTEIPICKWFINTEDAVKILINVHQFGYKVISEKENKYLIKISATGQYLFTDKLGKTFFTSFSKMEYSKEDLKRLEFDWVFDHKGIEIEEV